MDIVSLNVMRRWCRLNAPPSPPPAPAHPPAPASSGSGSSSGSSSGSGSGSPVYGLPHSLQRPSGPITPMQVPSLQSFSAGKIYGPPSVILSSQLRVFADLRSPCQFFATPAAVTALLGKRSVAGRTSQLTQQFSAMRAFQLNAPCFVPNSR